MTSKWKKKKKNHLAFISWTNLSGVTEDLNIYVNCFLMMQIEDITFSADTGHVLDRRSRTTGAFSGYASSFLLDLPQVAGGILTGDGLYQMGAGLQRTAGLPQHLSPPLSETWQRRGRLGREQGRVVSKAVAIPVQKKNKATVSMLSHVKRLENPSQPINKKWY